MSLSQAGAAELGDLDRQAVLQEYRLPHGRTRGVPE